MSARAARSRRSIPIRVDRMRAAGGGGRARRSFLIPPAVLSDGRSSICSGGASLSDGEGIALSDGEGIALSDGEGIALSDGERVVEAIATLEAARRCARSCDEHRQATAI
ncbi:hypothetical protein WMF20_22635 [Sorangium sp. So ce834]|uniref:hypothetical protein n=1 Tax=Sorangium sp. So ce834 TaxID=3133321 RepID=UPI003F5ECA92